MLLPRNNSTAPKHGMCLGGWGIMYIRVVDCTSNSGRGASANPVAGATSVSTNGRARSRCKKCGGSSICKHQWKRSRWKQCGGSGICKHQWEMSRCRQWRGSSICSTSESIFVSCCCAFWRMLSFDDLALQAQTFILKMIETNVIDMSQSHYDQVTGSRSSLQDVRGQPAREHHQSSWRYMICYTPFLSWSWWRIQVLQVSPFKFQGGFLQYCGYDWRIHRLAWSTLARQTRAWISVKAWPARRVPRQWQPLWCSPDSSHSQSFECSHVRMDIIDRRMGVGKTIFIHT